MGEINYKNLYENCIKTSKEMLEIQKKNVISTNEDPYSVGLYNGLVLCHSMLTLKEPKYWEKGGAQNG